MYFCLFITGQSDSSDCPVTPEAFKVSNQEKAVVGKSFTLKCFYNGRIDLNKDNVEWGRGNDEIYVMRRETAEGQYQYKDRTTVSKENLKAGDASLTILNVTDQDKGQYCCCIVQNGRRCINVSLGKCWRKRMFLHNEGKLFIQ